MNPAKFAMLASALILGVGGFFVVSSMNHEKTRSELAGLIDDVAESEDGLARVKANVDSLELEEALALKNRTAAVSVVDDGVDDQKKALVSKLDAMKKEWADTSDAWRAAIKKTRDAATKLDPFDLDLPDGSKLQGCTIKEVSDTSISIIHSAGVAKLTGKNIPAELLARYLPGWAPEALPELAATGLAETTREPGSAPAETSALETSADDKTAAGTVPLPDAKMNAEKATKRADLQKRIADLRAKSVQAQSKWAEAQAEYEKYMMKVNEARLRGGASSSKQFADQALKRANEIRGQINAAAQQIQTLEQELTLLTP